MKKILAILIVGIFVVSIPAASSSMLPKMVMQNISNKPVSTTYVPEWADGNITGVFGVKNETGDYEILGNIFGYYGTWWGNISGGFEGTWETLDGNQSGCFSGWWIFHIALGKFNMTGSEEEGGYLGLFRTNTTDMTIKAIAFGSYEDEDFVRYAMCSYTKFE